MLGGAATAHHLAQAGMPPVDKVGDETKVLLGKGM